MPQKKEHSVGASSPSQGGDDLDGMRARVKVLETKLADFDQMAARFAVLEREFTARKNDATGDALTEKVREIVKEERHQGALGVHHAAGEIEELDRKVQELDKGLQLLDQCVVKCSRSFTQFEKEQRQNVAHLQVNLKEKVREVGAKVESCASRSEIKMALKSVQFDMLNHSNACRSLAGAVTVLKKKLDVKIDTDDGIEEILRWDSSLRESDAAKANGAADGPASLEKELPNKNNASYSNGCEDALTRSNLKQEPIGPPGPTSPPPPGPPPDILLPSA
jgi:hypothetical protein